MVPPVEHFISSLPDQSENFAVPFVTWGAVNSGVALHEMGVMLINKGFAILGAAKVCLTTTNRQQPSSLRLKNAPNPQAAFWNSCIQRVSNKLALGD